MSLSHGANRLATAVERGHGSHGIDPRWLQAIALLMIFWILHHRGAPGGPHLDDRERQIGRFRSSFLFDIPLARLSPDA
jgi:hypothetical protein